ncbi:uncharacterized mitochondrial protein AtMg00810-like [Aristolochia californica]|uniref:uncharacterized mitochondrial protein AtMg00810-like n=1 Tax=Aristolochia californica TaxID=171875 RepID=UPI0035D87920
MCLSSVQVALKPVVLLDADISTQPPKASIDTTHVEFTNPSELDVKNAFLNGDIKEEIYMHQPPSFLVEWQSVLNRSFCLCEEVLLMVYVNDIVLTSSDANNIKELKEKICKEFKKKDLRLLKYFLGIDVFQSKHGIVLSQRKYVLDLLEDIWIIGYRPLATPMDANTKLCASSGEDVDIDKYKKLVGKLIYLTVTKLDISYAVGVVSQYMHKTQLTHWQALERILKYLKGSSGKGLLYKNHGHFNIEGFLHTD